jgi:RNA polymerase sigma factor (sigma-70 family)
MQQTDNSVLLRQYAEDHSDEAFAELVTRHIDLVYSVALRHVGDPHQAEEVTQAVFITLAKKATQLRHDKALSSWLFQATRLTASNFVRGETRRHRREQEAHMQAVLNESRSDDWPSIAPWLDDAVAGLSEKDRLVIVLRFYEGRNLREVGAALGASEDAAQKRISRAIERLREYLAKHGVPIGASGLVVAISANAVQAAPVGLAIAVSTAAALAGTAVSAPTVIAAIKTITMTTFQKVIITATVTAGLGAGIYQAYQAATLRRQNQSLQKQQAALVVQVEQSQRERDDVTNRLTLLADELAQMKGRDGALLRLRAEVTKLGADAGSTLTEPSMQTWLKQVALLKQKLEQMPDKKIPELQFATDKDWANAVFGADLTTDDGVREALSKLREEAENKFLNEMMKAAFKQYLAAHDGILPADLYQLKPYFDVPVTDEMLQRYKLLQTGKPDNSANLVTLEGYVDQDYDSNHQMSINGASGGRFNLVQQTVGAASAEFAKDNYGQTPTDPSQIAPYLKTVIDPVTIQKYLTQLAADPPPPEVVTLMPALKAYGEAHNGQWPSNPSELVPYLTTPEQRSAFQKLEPTKPTPR